MAVDSATKRYNMLRLKHPVLVPLPVPDASIDAGDRGHVLNLYGSLLEVLATVKKLYSNSRMSRKTQRRSAIGNRRFRGRM